MWVSDFNGKQGCLLLTGNPKSLNLIWLSLCFQAYYLLFLPYFKTVWINKMIPHPNPKMCMSSRICACYPWQKGLCRCDLIKIMRWGVILDFFLVKVSGLWNLSSLIRACTLGPWQWECSKSWTTDDQGIPDPGLFEWMQCNQSQESQDKEENKAQESGLGELRMEGRLEEISYTEEKGRGHKPREARIPLVSEGSRLSPRASKNSLVLAKWDLFQTCDLQKL